MKVYHLLIVLIFLSCQAKETKADGYADRKNQDSAQTTRIVVNNLQPYQGYWHCTKYSSIRKPIERTEYYIELQKKIIEDCPFRIYNDTIEFKDGEKYVLLPWKGIVNKHTYSEIEKKNIQENFGLLIKDSLSFLIDNTPVKMFVDNRKRQNNTLTFEDIIIDADRLLLTSGVDYYLFEKFSPANAVELINSNTPWPIITKNIILQDDGCFKKSTITLPYKKILQYDSMKAEVHAKYEELKCVIGNSEEYTYGKEPMRYIPFPNKDNIRVILAPYDMGDFPYNFYLLLIVNDAFSDKLYVEGIHYEPEDFEHTRTRSYFEIDKDYNILVTTEQPLGSKTKEVYYITDGGKFVKK